MPMDPEQNAAKCQEIAQAFLADLAVIVTTCKYEGASIIPMPNGRLGSGDERSMEVFERIVIAAKKAGPDLRQSLAGAIEQAHRELE